MASVVKRGTRSQPRYYGKFKDLDGRYRMRALKGARTPVGISLTSTPQGPRSYGDLLFWIERRE